jgi:hypothetical protein
VGFLAGNLFIAVHLPRRASGGRSSGPSGWGCRDRWPLATLEEGVVGKTGGGGGLRGGG